MKLSLIIALILFSVTSYSQNNALLISFQPQDNGIGLRTDIEGYYGSITYGNYHTYHLQYIKDHVKIAAGIRFQPRAYRNDTYLTVGVSYHSYGDNNLEVENRHVLRPISAEFGVTAIMNKFVAGFRFDPIKWEGSFDLGINITRLWK